jgi:LacI family transcriptional regulator
VTLSDVAREAGVSLATASRSINGSDRKVNEEYRQRVLEAAARLGYIPNLSAQAVAKGSTSTVALLVSDIADPYFSGIASGVINEADAHGLIVTMAVTERSASRELALVRTLRGQRPRFIILVGSRSADASGDVAQAKDALIAELNAFEASGGRVVMISQHELPYATVLLDNYEGARELARQLVSRGYRQFAAISGNETLLTSSDRLRGFTDGLAESDIELPAERIARAEFTRNGGYDGARRLIASGLGDTQLIFAVNDVMAVGAMSALREAGRAPDGGASDRSRSGSAAPVAVAGFDDIPTALDVFPALTTVRVPLEQLGRTAIELAMSDAADPSTRTSSVSTTVVLRDSTPPI